MPPNAALHIHLLALNFIVRNLLFEIIANLLVKATLLSLRTSQAMDHWCQTVTYNDLILFVIWTAIKLIFTPTSLFLWNDTKGDHKHWDSIKILFNFVYDWCSREEKQNGLTYIEYEIATMKPHDSCNCPINIMRVGQLAMICSNGYLARI